MSVSLLSLYRLVAGELGYAQGTCSGSGASGGTTIVDSSGDSPMLTTDTAARFANWWAMIESLSAGSTNLGEVRRITTYTPSTQTLTTPAFTAQTTNAMTYGLYAVPPTRDSTEKGIVDYLNDTLRALFYWYDVLLTTVTDGDMETSGVANWTVVNQDAATKSTATGVTSGDQALRTQNTSANGYARPAAIAVSEGQVWDVCVDVTPATGSCQIQTYDVTNSAEIDISDAYDGTRSARIWVRSTVPTDCKSMQVRLIGVEANADIYWDNLSVRHTQAVKYAMPSWFVNEDWIDYLWLWRPGTLRNEGYAIDELRQDDVWWDRPRVNHAAYVPYEVEIPGIVPNNCHLFAKCTRPYAEFTHSGANLAGSTTDADQDWVKAWALAKIFFDRGDEANYKRWLTEARQKHAQFQPRIQPKLRLQEVF